MGVPKFFRWLSERYPKIIQRHGSRPVESTCLDHFGTLPPQHLPKPDPMSECGLPPEIDRLYLDMNGIIHGCSHNNNDDDNALEEESPVTEEQILRNISYYLDRIVKDVAKPKELVYLAIDGVAPRAKLNQQRSRRYRSGKEGEIEQTVYDAHVKNMQREKRALEQQEQGNDSDKSSVRTLDKIQEVEPGRFVGKFETNIADSGHVVDLASSSTAKDETIFHSNAITPGTRFMETCTRHIQDFIRQKLETDPAWQHLTIIFSSPNVPGEGEHKILQFIREQQQSPDYNPNLRHCIMGQDGDLIMLGLVTHEPNLVLLREQVLFDKRARRRDALAAQYGLDVYIHNANFEFLHMSVLRDYLAYEFETSNVLEWSAFDLERTIDDFVFLTFFVGNDFLPHMPALDIADEAFDLLFYTYRDQRKQWLKVHKKKPWIKPYLTDSGNIISGRRLEFFLRVVGSHETSYYDYKKETTDHEINRKVEAKYGNQRTPSDSVMASKEEYDRERFRDMMRNSIVDQQAHEQDARFTPVLSSGFQPQEEQDQEGRELSARMSNLLQLVSSKGSDDSDGSTTVAINDQDLKGRYYYDKFGFSPFDAEKHVALRKAYIEGLVWNLKYYYQGCVSWDWYYPYHFGPMLSDLVGLNEILSEISFDGKLGEPLKPFEQLLACLPPSHADLLPEPFRPLMTEPSSPIAEFYPRSFTVDMNGKRWPWEAVVLLPFIDSGLLLDAAARVDDALLAPNELCRNQFDDATVLHRPKCPTSDKNKVEAVPLDSSPWYFNQKDKNVPVFSPSLPPGVENPLPGLPTLRDGMVHSLFRKLIRINVHGIRSRYKTSCLELYNVPEIVTVEMLAQQLIGSTVFMNYPHFVEAFVTAVSDANVVFRGDSPVRQWTLEESLKRKERLRRIVNSYIFGEKQTGTGGVQVLSTDKSNLKSEEEPSTLIHVRPFKRLETMADGTVVKTYAKFEVELPFFVTAWMPHGQDSRLANIAARLEKDPYNGAQFVMWDLPSASMAAESRRSGLLKLPDEYKYTSRRRETKIVAKTFHTLTVGTETGVGTSPPASSRLSVHCSRSFREGSQFGTMSPRCKYTTSMGFGRSTTVSLGNYQVQRKISSVVTTKKPWSPRSRVLAAGFVAACAFLSGCKAERPDHVPTPFHRAQAPSFSRPAINARIKDLLDSKEDDSELSFVPSRRTPPLEFAHGTTTLSFVFQGGIVAAVDSRASLGSFVGSKTTQKVLPVNSHLLGTMAGGAADCSFWIRLLRSEATFYELLNDGKRMSVARASRLLSNVLYENRGFGLSIGTMIMGFDDDEDEERRAEEKGRPPRIYYIDNSGMRIEGDLFAVGSGSTFALGILDTERRFDMTVEEAVALGIKAIRHATFRDAYSGGFINVFLITRKYGWKRVYSEDLARLSKEPHVEPETTTELQQATIERLGESE